MRARCVLLASGGIIRYRIEASQGAMPRREARPVLNCVLLRPPYRLRAGVGV